MRQELVLLPALLLALARPAAAAADDYVFAVTTDYGTSGQCATIGIDPPWPVETNVAPAGSDPVVRSHRNLIYVVNRLGADDVQVIDPAAGFATILEFSVGAGSNPQDIAFAGGERAYVSRYESVWLYEVNLSTGAITDSIDLSSFADADGLPEMSRMAIHGGFLFVQIQRIDRAVWTPTPPSYLAVIDIATNALVDVDPATPGVQGIVLAGLNPTGEMSVDEEAGEIFVGETGVYLVLDGGIERIDAAALASAGFVVTESDLGGDVGTFAWGGATGFVNVSDDWFFSTRLVSFSTATGAVLDTLYATDGFVPDMECDTASGQLFLCDRKATAPGVHVFDTATGVRLTAVPINTGLPPENLVVVHPAVIGIGDDVARDAPGRRASWAQPNPSRGETRIFWRTPVEGAAAVVIYDVAGRAVRVLASAAVPEGIWASIPWDGRDDRGRPVAPGIYFFRFGARGESGGGRLVVVR